MGEAEFLDPNFIIWDHHVKFLFITSYKTSREQGGWVDNKENQGLVERYVKLKERLDTACLKSGRVSLPRLVAVSKKQGLDKIKELYRLGHRDFGENYLQELEKKSAELLGGAFSGLRWSFIGQLQSNKIQKIVSLCSEVQSLASLAHAQKVEAVAKDLGKDPFPVFVLVNAGDEDSKFGLSLRELPAFRGELEKLRGLRLMGIMAIPPRLDLSQKSLKFYEGLYRELSCCAKSTGEGHLSLGMSGDLELAVSCGSDCVRIGTALFGSRS